MPPIVLDEDEDVGPPGGELQRGTPIRIHGLQGATYLNGQVALVIRFLSDKARYEVSLHSDGSFKSVQPANITVLPVLDEVELWRDELLKPEVNAQMANVALQRLDALEVSVDVLQRTRVGKAVNELAKRLAGDEGDESVAELGRRLVKRWREMFQRQQAADRRAAALTSAAPSAPSSTPSPAQPPSPAVQAAQQAERAKPSSGPSAAPAAAAAAAAATPADERSASSLKLPRIEKTEDAPRLVRVMRNATTDSMRLAAIVALEQTESVRLPDFLAAGGLIVLDRWLRANIACREGCLNVIQRLPVAQRHIAEARIASALSLVATTERDEVVAGKAAALQRQWRAAGLLDQVNTMPLLGAAAMAPAAAAARPDLPREEPAPERKRAKIAHEEPLPSASAAPAAQAPAAAPPAQAAPQAAKRWPPEVQRLQESLLPMLSKLDPRITQVLMERPLILEFLAKHRSVMTNMNAQTIAFLVRNLRNSKDTQEESTADDEDDGGTCTVTVSNLHPEANEDDVQELLHGANLYPVEVNLPRESRRQRSCGVAFAVLPTREAARAAVRELQGAVVRGRAVRVEPADGTTLPRSGDRGARRISWKNEEELWDVALFDKQESVLDFRERVQNSWNRPSELIQVPADASARFQAAARKEHEEERKLVRDALAHQSR